jgi:hypothetical protein
MIYFLTPQLKPRYAVETQEKTLKKGRDMKKSSILAQLAIVGVAVGLISAVPSMAADVAADTTTKSAPKKHHKQKKAAVDSTAVAAPAAAPADTGKVVKKHRKHKKVVADSSAKM